MLVDFPKSGGLCNRLKGLISVFQFEPKDENISLYWPPVIRPKYKKQINLEWFLNNKFEIRNESDLSFKPEFSLKRLYVTEDDVSRDFARFNPVIEEKKPAIDFEYDRIPQKVKERLIPYFKRFKFCPEILNQQFDTTSYIGVHLRNDALWSSVGFIQPMDLYFKAIDSLNSNDKIFVVSHTEKEFDVLKQRYGDRIITVSNPIYKDDSKEFIQQVILKILLLGNCHAVVFDRRSSIPEIAWWLGDCKFKPVFIQKDIVWRRT